MSNENKRSVKFNQLRIGDKPIVQSTNQGKTKNDCKKNLEKK